VRLSIRPPPRGGGRTCVWPWLLVLAAIAWSLVRLRAETYAVSYLDDSTVHEQMARFATSLLRSGHLPLTSWFPFLALGSPQFLHYQSLPSILTGALGLVIGSDVAYRWTLYLLLSLWPLSVYLAARLFGASRTAAGISAAVSPFLVSPTGIGYEQRAYIWTGFGVWTQLWASVTLPLAWGFGWRAISRGTGMFWAVVFASLTTALHFETGYLALLPLVVWPVVADSPRMAAIKRGAIVLAGSLLTSAWVVVPLLDQRTWAAINEPLQTTPLVNGYGAGRVLGWLVFGQLLDHGRLPVLTVLAASGLLVALARIRPSARDRALLVVLGLSLLLSFGRTTFGSLVDTIPGSGDIFFRRFTMGVQLSAVLLAGGGAEWCGRQVWDATAPYVGALRARALPGAAAFIATIAILTPAWLQLGVTDRHNASSIKAQRVADATAGGEVDKLIARVKAADGGRVYAGTPSGWGSYFTVGAVPVFKYLERRDVDEVGYALRTASLMTDPEAHFDETNPSDYVLFGIRYLILPAGWSTPVPARLISRAGPYVLWTTRTGGYFHVGTVSGAIAENRTDVGVRSAPLLRSQRSARGEYLAVKFGGADSRPRALPAASRDPAVPVGAVVAQDPDLSSGEASARVRMRRAGVVVLSASFDPGWKAIVDGHPAPTQMVAPAIVAARVGRGTHMVVFRYEGYRGYPWLFALSGLTLIGLALATGRRARTASTIQ
jgi:hypothetical protein